MRTQTYGGWPMTPMVKRILIINAVVWLMEVIAFHWLNLAAFIEWGALTPNLVFPGWFLWQPFTYMWLHSPGDFLHILFNMLFLWMFGASLEQSWGSKPFLQFYLICGIGAGVVVFIFGKLFSPDIPVLGASGAIYGLVVAWAVAYPNRIIYFFGVFPMKGKHFVLIPIGFAIIDFLMRAQGVSHAAHLGGMATGALLITGYWRPDRLKKKLRYWWLRRKLKVMEGSNRKGSSSGRPPNGGYWH